jgi:hypothetical protein
MKRTAAVILALTFSAALQARGDEWSKTFKVTGKPELRVETSDANIRVNTWDQPTIEAKVTTARYKIGEGGIRIEEHQNGDSVELEVRFPHHNFEIGLGWHDRRVDIDIHMPREGRINFHTSDGKIEVSGLKGDMDLRSGDGSQDIDNVEGKLRAMTGDGHIRANGRFDELELKTGDGRVEARAAAGSSLTTGWRLETGDGSVSLEVPENLAADVDFHTGDGHIDLDMPVATQGKLRQNEVRGKLNGGGNLLLIHTGDGSIRLRKG